MKVPPKSGCGCLLMNLALRSYLAPPRHPVLQILHYFFIVIIHTSYTRYSILEYLTLVGLDFVAPPHPLIILFSSMDA